MSSDHSGATMAKRLASSDLTTRTLALRDLRPFLSSSAASLSDLDLLKIWKGLFYCVWHADKLPAQLALINDLSSLLLSLPTPFCSRYFASFLFTIRHEWAGIDSLRLDKFYLLIRRFFHQFFAVMSGSGWAGGFVGEMVSVFEEKTLLSTDKFPARGVNYHVSQVFLDEILGFLPVRKETLQVLFKPFFFALESSNDKVLVSKIKSGVFDRLFDSGVRYLEKCGEVESGSEVEKFGAVGLAFGFSTVFFESARAPKTLQGNRKVLFGLHSAFMKLEKDLEKSGLKVILKQGNEDSNGGVAGAVSQEQIVENGEKPVQCSKEKASKKRKKNKKSEKGMGNSGIEVSLGHENGDLHNGDVRIADSDNQRQVEVDSKKDVQCSNGKPTNKRKKGKDVSGDGEKKTKKKKKKNSSSSAEEDNTCTLTPADTHGSVDQKKENDATVDCQGSMIFNEQVMSNLQKQFERVAAESGMATPVAVTKKRKKTNSLQRTVPSDPSSGENTTGKSVEVSAKRVRFSMKNNVVWKPNSPLPPQSLRLPPSVTPRGSALKKGIPPGPVRETPPSTKKAKDKANSLKKARKRVKGVIMRSV